MATCLLIGLYLHEERQVDRFHEHADRIVQVGLESAEMRTLYGSSPLARIVQDELAAVERVVMTHTRDDFPIAHRESGFTGDFRIVYTEPSFFEVFSFPVVAGDGAAALEAPEGLVLTESLAHALFGDVDPIGQTIHLGGTSQILWRSPDPVTEHTVRAVVADPPSRSSLHFDVLAPVTAINGFQTMESAWQVRAFHIYALLVRGATVAEAELGLASASETHLGPNFLRATFMTPLTSVYLSELHQADGLRGQRRYVYVFGFAALFILLIAGINYVNLAAAQGLRRAREVGVRKAIGASRTQVARQFLGESAALCLAALVLGLGATALVLPGFNALFGTEIALREQTGALTVLALFVLAVGVAAAAYPAFVLSRFEPVRVLRGYLPSSSGGGGWLRKSLMVVQFTASSMLLIGTAVVFAQLQYVQKKDLGFDGEQIVVFELPAQRVGAVQETLRNVALVHTAVEQVTLASSTPGWHRMTANRTRSMISPQTELDPDEVIGMADISADEHFLETLGMRIVAGRGFDAALASGVQQAVVINEATVRALGWTPEGALGKPLLAGWSAMLGQAPPSEVIGVISDFHVTSLHDEILPVAIQHSRQPSGRAGPVQFAARLSPEDIPGAMRHLEATLTPFAPEGGLSYAFLDDRFHALYASERRLARVVAAFALLAVLVAGLGLFGLTALAAQQRTREVGIRKVLGASVTRIVALLSKDLLKLVAVAFVLAVPGGYWMMNRWLEDFAYRIDLGPGIFLLTGGIAAVIALLTVSYHALRAATADPVTAIRAE